MRGKIAVIALLACAVVFAPLGASAQCPGFENLPAANWVNYTVPGASSTLDTTFSRLEDGYDIGNGTYVGWSIDDWNLTYRQYVDVWCSYDPFLPGNLGLVPWDLVNYILNNKQGTSTDVQLVLWVLTFGSAPASTAASAAMLADAAANGAGFFPGPGQIVALIAYTRDGGINASPGASTWQDTIFEVEVPGNGGGEGFTPGYWKNHVEDWGPTGLSPDDDFDTVFGTDFFDPDITLLQAARKGGGGVKKAARHGTAALLNAWHPEVDYPYTPDEVIAIVQSGDIELLVEANELGGDTNP